MFECNNHKDTTFFIKIYFFLFTVNINALGSSGKPLYLYYGYTTQEGWMEAISSSNASVALEKISNFLTPYNVSGLILKNLNYDYDSVSTNFYRQCGAITFRLNRH
jgi:hypothetical protein